MTSVRHRINVCILTAILGAVAARQANAGDVFTQVPEIAPSNTSQPAQKPDGDNKSLSALLSKGNQPVWIWGNDANTEYHLQKSFETRAVKARLKATCDNGMVVHLNGKEVARSDSWENPVEVDVTKYLKQGKNALSANVKNAGGASGFILKLVLVDANGNAEYVVSDKTWTAATPKRPPEPVKVLAKMGGGPWRGVFSQPGGLPGANSQFELQPGFQVERLFTVPKDQLGSWVCLTVDDKGRLLASDQGDKGLFRITPGAPGTDDETRVERLDVKMTSCQGMLHAFGALYCSVNGGPGSGLYRLKDTDGDDQYDDVVKLKAFRGGGEHGPHALRLAPDGKSIYVVAGNHTDPPFDSGEDKTNDLYSSRLPSNWREDLLLPRQWDANGHARGRLAPGGWIARTDPDGKTWEIMSSGYRNTYDMDFNADGELFAYDADMEWDFGSPWYRPTRVVHATSGSEFGWRSGTGKWPTYYPDTLPPVVNIGPGSPVGVSFGYGTKFPAKFQKALYLCDWTFGTMYAIHLTPRGSTYAGQKTEFLSRSPLPLTDVTIGRDGAMYFTVGGRGTQSELYRVTYVGDESTAPAKTANARFEKERQLRHQIEQFQNPKYMSDRPAEAAQFVSEHLNNPDRFTRYAAVMALASRTAGVDVDGLLASEDVLKLLSAVIALVRSDGYDVPQQKLLAALDRIDFTALGEARKLDYLRALSLVFIRKGEPDAATRKNYLGKLDSQFPTASDDLNRELLQMLVYLQSPTVVEKAMPLLAQPPLRKESDLQNLIARNRGYGGAIAAMLANQPDLQQYYYAFVLRNAKKGWTVPLRKIYFEWFDKAHKWSGGNSYQKFLTNISDEAFANAPETDRSAIDALGARKPYVVPELPKPKGPGREWTVEDILSRANKLTGRDYKNGRKMFAATRCIICHRFAGDGGATGPDLTQLAGRFTLKDLAESIVNPSQTVSDQYRASIVATDAGNVYTGRIVSETKDKLIIVTDPEDSTKIVEVKRSDVDEMKPSAVSLMPKDLLKPLNENEVLDLLAYLLSRGDPEHAMFRK